MRHRCMHVSDWLWSALLRLALLGAQQPYSASSTDLVRKGRSRLIEFWASLNHLMPSTPSKRNSVLSIHIRCSRTASLRATATTARRRPFVRINRMPHDFSCDAAIVRISIAFAAEYSVERTSRSPARDILPGLSLSPDWYRRGVRPKCAATVREHLNREGSSTAALNVSAHIGPTPGTVISRMQTSS